MSIWFSKRSEDGRKEIWQVDVDLLSVVFVIGVLASFMLPRWMRGPVAMLRDGIVLAAFGLLSLVVAKVSLFRRGTWVSWGPRQMGKWAARFCRLAYLLLALGAGLILLAYAASRT